jgi:uncharacterized protein YjbI with pentapeptide repeats
MSGTSTTDNEIKKCAITSDDLEYSEKYLRRFNLTSWSCSRPVWNDEYCVWHVDATGNDKPIDSLATELGDGDLHLAKVSKTNLSSLSFPDGTGLINADLSDATLSGANLPEAVLPNANLSKADLSGADLAGARLAGADLSEADLAGADLSEADLRDADLSEAYLAETTFTDAKLARSTQIGSPSGRIKKELTDSDSTSREQLHDIVSRVNHELQTAYSASGLPSRARKARVRERKARRRKARAQGGRRWGAYLWSCGSQLFTGYGLQIRWIGTLMIALWLLSAAVYWDSGMTLSQSLYYSIVTFTTSPPSPPPPGFAKAVAGFETFAGTVAIVFLGYILGTRERV